MAAENTGRPAVNPWVIALTVTLATFMEVLAAIARIYQAVGLAFLFVPINTAVYAFLPKEKNNQASSLINLARNVRGSVGISVVTTLLARRTQVHQSTLAQNVNSGSGTLSATLKNETHLLMSHGSSAFEASRQAYALVANAINQQATMLAYIDNF